MMTRNHLGSVFTCALVLSLLLAPAAFAQNPTGTMIGNVTDTNGGALPGVTVTATSDKLQGTRTTQSGPNGDYKLAFLPPGLYRTTYELEGFSTAVKEVRVSGAQTAIADTTLQLGEVVEEILVTGNLDTISETTTASVTYGYDEVEDLPINRDIEGAVALAPGVHQTGPSGNISISGAMSFENLWLINGVVVNENVRGQSLPLFIEDAIQETTTSTSGISAEYGRFTGGVVNVLTKSGGNEFSGSVRLSYDNEDWESENADEDLQIENLDETNDTLEATLGGPIWRDRLWFFAAYRDRETEGSNATFFTQFPFTQADAEERFEGKLTASVTPSHTLTGSYIEIDRLRTNTAFTPFLDLQSLAAGRTDPQELKSINYTGILTSSFFVEAQYSEREFAIGVGSGGPSPQSDTPAEFARGTAVRSSGVSGSPWYNATIFCADCQTETRNNENLLLKGSYFLPTQSAGTHDFVFGYDTFADMRFAVNHQTGSDFAVWDTDTVLDAQGNVYPIYTPGLFDTWIAWFAVFNEDIAAETEFRTNSFYVNDSWQLNDHWSFTLGARYDENDGSNSSGVVVADDDKISPRLGLAYDVGGDGNLVFNASYGKYVAQIAGTGNTADITSTAGAIGLNLSYYGGPPINTGACQANPSPQTCLSSLDATTALFDWYFSQFGGRPPTIDELVSGSIPNTFSLCIPGATTVIEDTLASPAANEITLGATKRLGSKGLFRTDVVWREWEDFYSNRVNAETIARPDGQIPGIADVTFIGNFGDDELEREYLGVHSQFRYRFTDRFTLAGNYSWSELEGNIVGETSGSGPVSSSPNAYPEFATLDGVFPIGRLSADQTHKARLWGIFEIFNTEHHNLSFSLLQSYLSGTPYGAADGIPTGGFSFGGTPPPDYLSAPSTVTYFFTDRDEFETDDITRTDISLNYSFGWNLFNRSFEIFVQPEVINVFNEDGVIFPNTTTHGFNDIQCRAVGCVPYDPTAGEVPVEGVNFILGPDFGEADNDLDYQQPRTFQISVGFRF